MQLVATVHLLLTISQSIILTRLVMVKGKYCTITELEYYRITEQAYNE